MEWKTQNQQQIVEELHNSLQNNIGQTNYEFSDGGGKLCMKVLMTDKQLDELRRQIAAYAVINERLVSMYNAKSAERHFSDIRPDRLSDAYMTSSGYRISTRNRWTPTPLQLQMLEKYFDEYKGSPSKQRIKEITVELSQYGHITESNVANWFQNRKARTKKKHSAKGKTELEDKTNTYSSEDKTGLKTPNATRILNSGSENFGHANKSLNTTSGNFNGEIKVMPTPHLPNSLVDSRPGNKDDKNQE